MGGAHQRHGQRGHGGGSGFVSGRQGEGGSLPSNVNTRSAEVHPFIAEMAAVPRKRGAKNNSESVQDHEMGLLNGESSGGGNATMSKAAARSVAARGTSVGFDTDIPYAQMDNSMSVIINMGEYSNEEDLEEEGQAVSIQQAKKVTTHVSISSVK